MKRIRLIVLAAFCGILMSCGGGGGNPSPLAGSERNPAALRVEPDDARAATAVIGPGGGTIEATGADGTRFSLLIPSSALAEEQTITLAPLKGISGLPDGATLVAGADCKPEGLTFAVPATLTVELATPPPSQLLHLGYQADGGEAELRLASIQGNRITFSVEHFSGNATVQAEAEAASVLLERLTSNPETRATLEQISAIVVETLENPNYVTHVADMEAVLKSHFNDRVKPRILSATDDPKLLEAIEAFSSWRALVNYSEGSAPGALNTAQTTEGKLLLATKLGDALARVNQRVLQSRNWRDAQPAFHRWLPLIEALELATAGNQLDFASIVRNLAVQVEITSVTAPSVIEAFESVPVEVRAGIKIGGTVTYGDPALRVDFTLRNGDPSSAVASTDAAGNASQNVTLANASDSIRGTVMVSFEAADLHPAVSASRDFLIEGKVVLVLSGPDAVAPGANADLVVRLSKGRLPLAGRIVQVSLSGGGSLAAPTVTMQPDGTARIGYTAPASGGGSATIVATYVASDQTYQASWTINSGTPPSASPDFSGSYEGNGTWVPSTVSYGVPFSVSVDKIGDDVYEVKIKTYHTWSPGNYDFYRFRGAISSNGSGDLPQTGSGYYNGTGEYYRVFHEGYTLAITITQGRASGTFGGSSFTDLD